MARLQKCMQKLIMNIQISDIIEPPPPPKKKKEPCSSRKYASCIIKSAVWKYGHSFVPFTVIPSIIMRKRFWEWGGGGWNIACTFYSDNMIGYSFFLRAFFLSTLSLRSFLRERDRVSHPYQTTDCSTYVNERGKTFIRVF
jgi:hypothetical protein